MTTETTDTMHYGRFASALHWLIGVALLAEIVFGFLLDDIAPRGTPARAAVINLHKSIGVLLGLLVVLRLAWRWRHAPPPWPEWMPLWQRSAARLLHAAMYVCMLALPLSGYVASNLSKNGIKVLGYWLRPWGPDLPAAYAALTRLHDVTAWLFAALVAGHVAVALKHALIDHDAVFARVWPWSGAARLTPGERP
jgi:cytochrome b561